MAVDIDGNVEAQIRSIPLSVLPDSTLKLLSNLLNPVKVLPAEGYRNMQRDWHGLAICIELSSEECAALEKHSDPTSEVLRQWQKRCPAELQTVGVLLQFLHSMDRCDVYDDVVDDLKVFVENDGLRRKNGPLTRNFDEELLTDHDRLDHKQMYDAFVLYANEDATFVAELKVNLSAFRICTKDDIRVGRPEYSSVIKLMTERCRYIIIVYSPAFLDSQVNVSYVEYAHTQALDKKCLGVIPIMYRECSSRLPDSAKICFRLHCDSAMYNVWDKLKQSLDPTRSLPLPPIALPASVPEFKLNGNTPQTHDPETASSVEQMATMEPQSKNSFLGLLLKPFSKNKTSNKKTKRKKQALSKLEPVF